MAVRLAGVGIGCLWYLASAVGIWASTVGIWVFTVGCWGGSWWIIWFACALDGLSGVEDGVPDGLLFCVEYWWLRDFRPLIFVSN